MTFICYVMLSQCCLLQVHHWVVLLVFSITFALSCTMFELIIFEIVGVLDSRLYLPVLLSVYLSVSLIFLL